MKLYRRGNSAHWWYRFSVPGSNERIRESTGVGNKSIAQAIAYDAYEKARAAQSAKVLKKAPTLRNYSEEFLRWLEATTSLKPNSKTSYRNAVNALLETKLADLPMNKIRNVDAETTDLGHPWSANIAIAVLRRMFSLAKETEKYFCEVPKLKSRKDAKGRAIKMTRGDCEKIAAYMTGDPKDALLLLRSTGMRPMELFAARWEYADLDRGTYTVYESKTEAGMRSVPLLWGLPVLQRRHLEQGCPTQGWIFPSSSKSGHIESIRDEFNVARDLAGFSQKMVPYTARHGFASDAAQVISVKELQGVLGHTTAQQSLRYQHVDADVLQAKLEQAATTGRIQ
jgi:integrase